MKRTGDSTPLCRSPTLTVNGCDLTPPTRTQTFEQENSYLASNRRPSTPYTLTFAMNHHSKQGLPAQVFAKFTNTFCGAMVKNLYPSLNWNLHTHTPTRICNMSHSLATKYLHNVCSEKQLLGALKLLAP